MHRLLVVSALVTVTGSALAAPRPDAARYGWHASYATARAEARRTGKPILLVFRCEP
jgi:hypothetical protein